MDLTVDKFYALARRTRQQMNWRYGQSLFNTLVAHRPDLSEQVRGTDKDPFHANGGTGDPRLIRFGEFINANWEKEK